MCVAMLLMLLVFTVGVERTENSIGCTVSSVLIQYFTLASVFWMGAEAVLMFKKLIIVFGNVTTKFVVAISLICWGNKPSVSVVLIFFYHCILYSGVPALFPVVGLATLATGNNYLIREYT